MNYNIDIKLIDNPLKYIQAGSFGIIYHTKYNNDDIALKLFKSNNLNNVINEIDFYKYFKKKSLSHDNILNIIGFSEYMNMKCLILEFCDFDLMELINWKFSVLIKSKLCKNNYQLIHDSIIYIIEHIRQGISFLHNKNILHLDIKPENILIKIISFKLIPKICDFGHAMFLKTKFYRSNKFHGTVFYAAPEVKKYNQLGFPADIYSFALSINLLLINLDYNIPKWIYKCLNKNPLIRPKIDDIDIYKENLNKTNKFKRFISKLNKCNIM